MSVQDTTKHDRCAVFAIAVSFNGMPQFKDSFSTDNVPVLRRTAWDNSRLKFSFCAVLFCNSLVAFSMFSSFHGNKLSTGLLMKAILLIFQSETCLLCVASEVEGTKGAVHTTVLEGELLETATWTGEPKTPACSLNLLNTLSGTTHAHCHNSVNPLRMSKLNCPDHPSNIN